MSLFVLMILVFLLIALLPMWDHSAQWGYVPSSGAGFAVIVLTLLLISGRLG
jgi:hypothetical protein